MLLLSALTNIWSFILLGSFTLGVSTAFYMYFSLKTKQGTMPYEKWKELHSK